MTITKRRRRPEMTEARKAEIEARRTAIDTAAQAVRDDDPDFAAFLARWGTRYNENNLRRLWVQYPRATCLHKFGTWRGMGRQVRKGEHAIWLVQPRTGTDPDKVTPDNPNGEVFYGASWMALFDYAQTDPIGDYADPAPADADPALAAEVKKLRAEAADAHPDRGGTAEGFMAAWARYEAAKARLNGDQR